MTYRTIYKNINYTGFLLIIILTTLYETDGKHIPYIISKYVSTNNTHVSTDVHVNSFRRWHHDFAILWNAPRALSRRFWKKMNKNLIQNRILKKIWQLSCCLTKFSNKVVQSQLWKKPTPKWLTVLGWSHLAILQPFYGG